MLICAALIHKCGQNTVARLRRPPSEDLSSIEGPRADYTDRDLSIVDSPADLLDVSSLEGPPSLRRASTDPTDLSHNLSIDSTEYRGLPVDHEFQYQTFLAAPPRIGSEVIDHSSLAHSSDFRFDIGESSSIVTPRPVRRRRSHIPSQVIDYSSLDGPSLLQPTVLIDPGPSTAVIDEEPPSPQSDAHWFILSKPLPPRPRSADSSFQQRRRRSIVYPTTSTGGSSLGSSLPSYDCTLQVASSNAFQRGEIVGEKVLSPDEQLLEEYLHDGLTRPPPYSNRNSVRRSLSVDPVIYEEATWGNPQSLPPRNGLRRGIAQQRNPAQKQRVHTDPPPVVPRVRPGRYYNGRTDFEDRKSSAKHDNDGHHFGMRMDKVFPSSWRRIRNLSG